MTPLAQHHKNKSEMLQLLVRMHHHLKGGCGSIDDFKNYLTVLDNCLPCLPLTFSSLYYQSVFHLLRMNLFNSNSYSYPGVFSDMLRMKRTIASRIERELPLSCINFKRTSQTSLVERVLFYIPYVSLGDPTPAVIALFFNKIRALWPDARFTILVGDDFYLSEKDERDLQEFLIDVPGISPLVLPIRNIHSFRSESQVKDILQQENIAANVLYTNRDLEYSARIEELMRIAEVVHPDICVAFSLESIVDTLLSRLYPTLRIGLGDFLPVAAADADVNLVFQELKDLEPLLKDNGLDAEIPGYRHFLFPVQPVVPKGLPARTLFNLNDKTFYLVSMSRHFDTGIFEDVCFEVRAFLERHLDCCWLLVGVSETYEIPEVLNHERIIKVSSHLDALELLNAINVLIPITHGTGTTALSAMVAGVPVLSTARRSSPYAKRDHSLPTDVALMLGTEYVSLNAPDLGKKLEKIYSDKDYAKQLGAALQVRAAQRIDQGLKQQLTCLPDVFERYHQRIKN